MSAARFIVGDSLTVLRTLPDASVDLVLTSPPFLALRSYLPADHPDKAQEIGGEPNPGEFVDTLLTIADECRRVLAPHGSLCFELGDTYSGSGGAGGDYAEGGLRDGQPKFRAGTPRWDDRPDGQVRTTTSDPVAYPKRGKDGWPLAKSLCLIPELFRIGLVYGINPLTGTTWPRWRARNVVRWVRPNPPVGALGDKFRPATSEMVVACTSGSRYFDLDAVRTPVQHPNQRATRNGKSATLNPEVSGRRLKDYDASMSAGAPPLDWWSIPTAPYKGAHYAAFPEELCVRPIASMCPQRVCTTCGEPSRRIVGEPTYSDKNGRPVEAHVWASGVASGKGAHAAKTQDPSGTTRQAPTLGWTDCGHHGTWRTGVVLDPFAGSGTTLAVATGHGRDAIGIDLDSRNADLAAERVGIFLTVEQSEAA